MKVQCENCNGVFEIKEFDYVLHYQGSCLDTPQEHKHRIKSGIGIVMMLIFLPIALISITHYVKYEGLDPILAIVLIGLAFLSMPITLLFCNDYFTRKSPLSQNNKLGET